METPETIFISGHAKLPAGITATELYKIVTIVLEVEPESGTIVAADCTLATALGRDFVSRLFVGKNLTTDVDTIIQSIENRFLGNARKALITATRVIYEKFKNYREGNSLGEQE